MKNIFDEKPSLELSGLPLANVRSMDAVDIRNRKILDIGCGFGWFEMHAVSSGAEEITGIEISDPDLATAKKHVLDPKVHFRVGSAIDLPFEKELFDTVVAWEVLEHIPRGSEPTMFREVHRVLKPGGAFYLSTPESSFVSKTMDPAWWLTGHRHYSKDTLCRFASQQGFIIEQVRSQGRYWTVLSFINLYIAKWVFRRRPFYENYVNVKVEQENRRDDGFADIFMRCIKAS
jgi:2-polyprenyl-3-methyl-5-hydroxy-6-metoxy-1,4-benzoquinol methylase